MDDSVRIWQLGMHFDPSAGGVDRYFDDLLKGLAFHDTVAAAFGGEDAVEGRLIKCSLGPRDAGLGQRRVRVREFGGRISKSPSPGVVATHFALYAFFIAGRIRNLPHIVHFHGPWSGESAAEGESAWMVGLKRWMERQVYRRASRCIVLSDAFRRILEKDFGVDPARIHIIPGTVDLQRFQIRGAREEHRKALGLDPSRRMIFCVRRMARRMGILELIRAFSEVAPRFPDVDLHFAGKGDLQGEGIRLAEVLGLSSRVVFHGYVADEDLPAFYGAADLSVVPSQELDGFGLVTLESLACGTPVAVTPVGGLPETVSKGNAGFVFSGRTSADMAAGLLGWLGNEIVLPTREECRSYVADNFSRELMIQRILQVYESALKSP